MQGKKPLLCTQCKAELPPGARQSWGYKRGNSMYFCSYGCMRAKEQDIAAKQKETWEKKHAKKMEAAKKNEKRDEVMIVGVDMSREAQERADMEKAKEIQRELDEKKERMRIEQEADELTDERENEILKRIIDQQKDKIRKLDADLMNLQVSIGKLKAAYNKLLDLYIGYPT